MREVDAVEEHGELGGIQLSAQSAIVDERSPEAALLEPLVIEDESTRVPGEDLRPVRLLREEDEEAAGVKVLLPFVADERAEAVDAVTHVDGFGSEQDADGSGQEH